MRIQEGNGRGASCKNDLSGIINVSGYKKEVYVFTISQFYSVYYTQQCKSNRRMAIFRHSVYILPANMM